MLNIDQIKISTIHIADGLKKRGIFDANSILLEIIELDSERKSIKTKLDAVLKEINELSNKAGEFFKNNNSLEGNKFKTKVLQLKEEAKNLTDQINHIEEQLKSKLIKLPNVPHSSVPDGTMGNEIVLTSEIKEYKDGLLPHWDLAKKYGFLDFETGNKITGAGFPIYKGALAKLQRALISFFLDSAIQEGYEEIQVPLLVNGDSGFATGQLPDKEGMMYQLKDEDLYLIPTAEVPIINTFRNTIINFKDLPIKRVGYSSCFRKEAGSWGSHVRGLNRLHQFDKVEIIQILDPQYSYDALEKMCVYVEGLLKKLELPFRKLKLCSTDLGFTSALTYDLEVYSAGQKKWLEVSSISNCEDFQSNRLKLRIDNLDNKKTKPHILNGSALALPRIVSALLENNQTQEGIKIPKILVPYTKFDIIKNN